MLKLRFFLTLIIIATLANVSTDHVQAQTIKKNIIEARQRMVDNEIAAAGVKNKLVLDAMAKVPRHEFVPKNLMRNAYYDMALPIGEGQTISPPFVVAYMTEQLDPQKTDKVLEIGTGSGYQAAILGELVKEVYSIEIVPALGRNAAKVLRKLRYNNVTTKVGDGFKGWEEHAPFDKIIVTCSPERIPKPLVEQLKEGGMMVIPLGERYQQTLFIMRKEQGKLVASELRPTLFVPMTGRAEELRIKFPNPDELTITNGSFEETISEDDPRPKGWYYLRQGEIVEDKFSPKGDHYLHFTNNIAGRGSRALQAISIDGSRIKEFNVFINVKVKNVRPGQSLDQRPALYFQYYDEEHKPCGEDVVGPWFGTFDWTLKQQTMAVPLKAKSAIIRVGLNGGVGEASFDNIVFEVTKRAK